MATSNELKRTDSPVVAPSTGPLQALERGSMVQDSPGVWYAPGENLRVGELVSEGVWRVASRWRDDYWIVEKVAAVQPEDIDWTPVPAMGVMPWKGKE